MPDKPPEPGKDSPDGVWSQDTHIGAPHSLPGLNAGDDITLGSGGRKTPAEGRQGPGEVAGVAERRSVKELLDKGGLRPSRFRALRAMLLVCLTAGVASAASGAQKPSSSSPQPRGPLVKPIAVPSFPGSYAVWGGVGSDSRGHVWFAICAKDVPAPSAHLYEYVPETETLTDRGDVVSELERAGVYRAGEGQMKIHSRIVQAGDGHLYFASTDEQGENKDLGKPPTWGGHLWRLRLPENKWEHLLATP